MQPKALTAMLDALPGRSAGWHGFRNLSVDVGKNEQVVTNKAEVEALVAGWTDATGWIARESGVRVLPVADDDPALGAVLGAELGRPGSSLRLRRLGAGWVWTQYDEIEGGTMLADDVVLVTTHEMGARYRRYWILPDNGAAEIGWCRLVGLEDLQ